MKTLLATIHVAIVVCHGNPVYRAVAWIPILVSVAWSPVFPTCGRFPWEAPTVYWWKSQKERYYILGNQGVAECIILLFLLFN
jgi:hypothetical protein